MVPSDSGTTDIKIGMEAMKVLLKKAEETKKTRALTLDGIRPFCVFPWLLEPVAKTKVDAWLAELTGSMGSVVAAAAATSTNGAGAKKAKLDAEKAKARKNKLDSLFK